MRVGRADETRRERNARWRADVEDYWAHPRGSWTSIELIWASRLRALLCEGRDHISRDFLPIPGSLRCDTSMHVEPVRAATKTEGTE